MVVRAAMNNTNIYYRAVVILHVDESLWGH